MISVAKLDQPTSFPLERLYIGKIVDASATEICRSYPSMTTGKYDKDAEFD